MDEIVPIDVRPLFKPLDEQLMSLLKSLMPEDWNQQTVAKLWKVKDVVSHMLDTKLRVLSMQRDHYFGEQAPKIESRQELINWLNQLNADWVKATKRLSPGVMILLLDSINDLVNDYYLSLDPWETAIFSVDWAGESTSFNWMHLAREYTEYWHHQQQIRQAVNQPGIMTRTFFYPVMDTFFQALPHTFKNLDAADGTLIEANISSAIGGSWLLQKFPDQWRLIDEVEKKPDAKVMIPYDIAWILFSKSLRPGEVLDKVEIEGDSSLAMKVLTMVSALA